MQDAWLDNIEWANVNTFKNKYSLEAEAEEVEETEEPLSDNESTRSQEDNLKQARVFEQILLYLKPGESVLRAIKRLGTASKAAANNESKAGLSASQRWLKKKTPAALIGKGDPEEAKKALASLEELTGHANHFIDIGYYDIYEDTFESLKLKLKCNKVEESIDIFADDLPDEAVASTSANQDNIVQGMIKIYNLQFVIFYQILK